VKASTSTPLPGLLSSCSALDVSKESGGVSGVAEDSRERPADCKEETASASLEESASSASGAAANQHAGRRRRRRNSGKTETPASHSTPVGKTPGCGFSQPFRTPRSGQKSVPGGRQQPLNKAKEQQKKKFQYGNYNKYYGYRNPGASEDARVRLLRPEWFEGKDVLDLGCNSGHLTLYIAKTLRPARILGLDIDGGLVHAARKNIRHYLSEVQTQKARHLQREKKSGGRGEGNGGEENGKTAERGGGGGSGSAEAGNDNGGEAEEAERVDGEETHAGSCSFPVSLRISRGPIAAPPLTEASTPRPGEFPSNVSFVKVRRRRITRGSYGKPGKVMTF